MKVWILWLVLAGVLRASTPMDVLLELLDHARNPQTSIDSLPGLFISPHIGPKRKAQLEGDWESLSDWVNEEEVEFFEGKEKIDGDLAAVMVGGKNWLGHQEFRVLLYGARKINGEWKITPVEGRFDNAQLSYDSEVRTRVRKLESWMMDQRATGGDELRSRERDLFIKNLKKQVSPQDLAELGPKQVLERFFAAIKAKKKHEVLVWLGILEEEHFPETDWPEIGRVVRAGLSNRDRQKVWSLLTDPEIVQVTAEEDFFEDESSHVILFQSPEKISLKHQHFHSIRFTILKTAAGWRVELPGFFRGADQPVRKQREWHRESQDYQDDQLSDQFAIFFEKEFSAKHGKSPKDLVDQVLRVLKGGTRIDFFQSLYRRKLQNEAAVKDQRGREHFEKLFQDVLAGKLPIEELQEVDPEILQRILDDGGLGGDGDDELPRAKNHLLAVDSLVAKWRQPLYVAAGAFYSKWKGKGAEFSVVEILEKDGIALAVLRRNIQPGKLDQETVALWMIQEEQGWGTFLRDSFSELKTVLPEVKHAAVEELEDQYVELMERLRQESSQKAAAQILEVDQTAAAVPKKEAEEVVKKWRMALRSGELAKVLPLSATLTPQAERNNEKILEDLSYLSGIIMEAEVADEVLESETKGRLTGVSLLVDVAKGKTVACPLFLVVPSAKGPRVLVDISLSLPTNGGKKMINKESLELAEQWLEKENFEGLQQLFEKHVEVAQVAWDDWRKAKKN